MKDKLRELAERWRIFGSRVTGHECADELLEILDAEGDGGAVGDAVSLESALAAIDHVGQHNGPGRSSQARAMLETVAHPARSGVVSDEDVQAACLAYTKFSKGQFPPFVDGMRAALEHFARRTP